MTFDTLGAHLPWAQRDRYLDLILELGLVPEVGFKADDLDRLSPADLEPFTERLQERGLTPTVHAPFFDLNPGALEPLVRRATLQRLTQTLAAARRLGARVVVVHPGFDPWRYPGMEALWVEQAASFFRELLDADAGGHCRIAIENIYEASPETLVALVDTLDHPRLGHCFDVGHWNIFGRNGLADWLEQVAPRLFHLHLHDNHGDRDAHLPVGDGTIDFAPLFAGTAGCRPRPSVTLEAHSPDNLQRSCRQLAALP